MNHFDFLNTYRNKKVDNDWSYWYQCVDLTHTYCREVIWYDHPIGNAFELSTKEWKRYIRIPNKLTNYPKQWDIIIFAPTPVNKYWHIAIVDNGNSMNVMVIEQNWWTGTWDWVKTNSIRLQSYNYINPKVICRYRYCPESVLILDTIDKNKTLLSLITDNKLKEKIKNVNIDLQNLIS